LTTEPPAAWLSEEERERVHVIIDAAVARVSHELTSASPHELLFLGLCEIMAGCCGSCRAHLSAQFMRWCEEQDERHEQDEPRVHH
jgi:hypothetical protein